VVVDPDNSVAEFDETDNEGKADVTVP